MALPSAVVAGIAVGAATSLVVTVLVAAWFVARRLRARRDRSSDTGSSEAPPPTLAEWGRFSRTASAPEFHGARQFSLEELAQATKNFVEANLVGVGSFGPVYKGLLLDGTVVAVKRREGAPRQEFVDEVRRLSEIWHRNVVTLIGYCQEGGLQMLVFEYLPNGSVCRHLYDTGNESMTRLEFKQRLSIAIGAAKGLNHLHSLVPPLIHRDFKTRNVLVDENFIAKVSDAGIDRLLRGFEDAGPSLRPNGTSAYQDPEYRLALIAMDPIPPETGNDIPTIELVLFGPTAQEIIGAPVDALIASQAGVGNFLPTKITAIYGKVYDLRVSVSPGSFQRVNISFQVDSVLGISNVIQPLLKTGTQEMQQTSSTAAPPSETALTIPAPPEVPARAGSANESTQSMLLSPVLPLTTPIANKETPTESGTAVHASSTPSQTSAADSSTPAAPLSATPITEQVPEVVCELTNQKRTISDLEDEDCDEAAVKDRPSVKRKLVLPDSPAHD